MDEEFYAVVKLVSGEEIFGIVSNAVDNDKSYLIISNPVVINKSLEETCYTYRIEPWMKLTDESLYILETTKIITIVKTFDESIVSLYKKYLSVLDFSQNGNYTLKRNEGYISSVKTAREHLEKSYSI